MKGLLISPEENDVLEVVIDEDSVLDDIYNAIGCRTIDVVRNINIGGRRYDIVVDDEGLFKDEPKPAARCMDAEQVLYGNIIVLNADEKNGVWETLSDDDIENINQYIFGIRDRKTMQVSPLLEFFYSDDKQV